jgi:ParB family chromosome partitioning protein
MNPFAPQGDRRTDERLPEEETIMSQPTRKRSGLGRGLASLIPTGPADGEVPSFGPRMGDAAADVVIGGAPATNGAAVADVGAVYREIDPSTIDPNPRQPRQAFDEEALAELVHSIREFGLMQPIVVRAVPGTSPAAPRYQLVMGERRWRAAQQAGLATIPAIVRETADDSMLRDALLENIHRVQLNPLEEAAAYQQLLDEFGVTHDELAARIGRSRPLITNMIRLLRLPIAVQRRVAAGVLSAGHARALLALEGGQEQQEELAARIVAEGLSVRATEEAVTLANRETTAAPSAPRRKPIHMPGLQDVAERLSTAFDTRVTVSLGKRKGKIVVEFGSVEDLQRIVDLMSSANS